MRDMEDGAFYGEITSMFERMEEEHLPEQDVAKSTCQDVLELVLERYGIMVVLTRLCGAISGDAGDCPHIQWLSNNLNVLVNGAIKHNQEKYGFPFGA